MTEEISWVGVMLVLLHTFVFIVPVFIKVLYDDWNEYYKGWFKQLNGNNIRVYAIEAEDYQ